MKNFFILIVLFFSTTLFANEVVNLKADLNLYKCEDGLCLAEIVDGLPIQVELVKREGSSYAVGEYQIEKTIDEYNVFGTILIYALPDKNRTKYFIQSFLLIANENSSMTTQLGSVVVYDDIKKLNQIFWKKEFGDNEYVASLVVGSSGDQ